MDVNGTRFQLLLGAADWGSCATGSSVAYDPGREVLALRELPFVFRSAGPSGMPPLTAQRRRGAARDRYGNWYWIDNDPSVLLVNSSGSGETTRFWPSPVDEPAPAAGGFGAQQGNPDSPQVMAGAAVTEDHYLVVGTSEPPGLLVFDLRGGGAPDRLRWPGGLPFTPFDLAPRAGGGVWVLDRAAARYWELDRSLRVVTHGPAQPAAQAFEPVVPATATGTACEPPRQPEPGDAVPVDPDPIAIDAAGEGTVLILSVTAAGPALRPYRDGQPAAPAVVVPGLPTGAHDMTLLTVDDPGRPDILGRLFIADAGGDQAFEYSVSLAAGQLTLAAQTRYYPMRQYGGRALVASGGKVWYDFADRWLALTELPYRRYETAGTVTTPPLDGGEPGCLWHRLLLDAWLPSETGIGVRTAAADDPAELTDAPQWRDEPAPYPRGDGSEIVYVPDTGARTLELAFQSARGRYLRIELSLTGNGRATPRIRALRAYYPRFSYLRYLPAVYRQDTGSASFLDRFLSNVEGIATTVEGRIALADLLFTPATARAEALDWLASWFDLALDPAWSEATRRLLLAHAMEFFAWRGTARGLLTAIALAVEDHPAESLFSGQPDRCAQRTRIVELYQTKLTPAVALGDPTEPAPPTAADRWSPADGAEALDARYRDAVLAAGLAPQPYFPTSPPADQRLRAVWTEVARAALGFVPRVTDPLLWQDFLTRRYTGAAALSAAHEWATLGSPAEAVPPDRLPQAARALVDWYQFQAVVVRGRETAHRFRVLLPVSNAARAGTDRRADLVDRVTRVVDLEKPAHTVFDVKFYWDAFRVGEARLGLDTLVDLGIRAPDMLAAAVLGRAHLGENLLATAAAADGRPLTPQRRCP